MTTQQIQSIVDQALLLKPADTTYINSKLEALIVWVDPLHEPSQPIPDLQLFVDDLNQVEDYADVEAIADEVFNQSARFVLVGVRADKSKRPIKS